MTEPNPPDERQTKPFAQILRELNGGRTHTELSETLQALVAAVKTTGKKGTLQFTLSLAESRVDGALEVVANVKSRLPEPKPVATIFYADIDSNLVRTNPSQTELDFDSPVRVAEAPGRSATS